MQILINNIKVIGIFIAISLISIPIIMPLWNIAEYRGQFALTLSITILFSIFTTTLFFFASRFFIRGTGVLVYDFLSLIAFIVIVIIGFIFIPERVIFLFSFPHLFLTIIFKNQILGSIISVTLSLLALLAGIITKSGITHIV